MRRIVILALAASAIASLGSAHVDAQILQGKFRGDYVCEKLPTTRGVLRVPVDLIIDGQRVWFARPLFNLNGDRVVGSEMAAGTSEEDGRVRLSSGWTYLGNTARGEYSGTITATGGTLTGTQTWTGPGEAPSVRRACTLAVVPTADHSRPN